MPRFRLLKVPPQPFAFLDFEEFEAVVGGAQKSDPQLALAVLLAGEAGLRRGELAGLKWQDVSFTLNKLTVIRELWRGKELPPKSGRSRSVPLTERLAREIGTTMRYMHLSPATLTSAIALLNHANLTRTESEGTKKARVSAGFGSDPTGT